jgi:probable rRNA maturation factor
VQSQSQSQSRSNAAPLPSAGDVVIATDVAARQAAARGEPAERELCRLLLHGMLHLVGMDHADPPRAHEPMLTLQERTLHCLLGGAASTNP